MYVKLSYTLGKHFGAGMLEIRRNGDPAKLADAVFLSLLREGMSHAVNILRRLVTDKQLYELRMKLERSMSPRPADDKPAPRIEGVYAAMLTGVAETSAESAGVGGNQAGVANSGHFLLWLTGNAETISSGLLAGCGVTAQGVLEYLPLLPAEEDLYGDIKASRGVVEKNRKPKEMIYDNMEDMPATSGAASARRRRALEKYAVNLSHEAAAGRIDPVVGRDKEIERLVQILGRRKKNNPVLIGEPGVGKSAVVEGLARRIHEGSVPHALADKEILSLDMASLIAGTKFRGEFEERLKKFIDEAAKSDDIILFIDEIHTIAGTGGTQGGLDMANILKPMLARGELQCIGATTLDEYREYIEKDGALERRFQKIVVEPASEEHTLHILTNLRKYYERHHGVRYTADALKACVELTGRYVTDRHFPDKAIDVMDEAGSKARIYNKQEPAALIELASAIDKAERDLEDNAEAFSQRQMGESRMRIAALRERLRECRAQWRRDAMAVRPEVGSEHIRQVVATMTGIPTEKVSQSEKKRLGGMYDHLSASVVGQDEAVRKVVAAVQRSRAGMNDPDKPVGVFMFVGPTGMGKTHLSKELGRWLFDRKDALIRIDMSEYSEKHNVSRMIGSPPGYVGYNEGGQLTEAVRRQPYSVVLFDEIEKAHPDVFNVMLQIFDDGQLTDGNGRKVDFRNTIIIMTSNVGSRKVASKPAAVGFNTSGREQEVAAGRNAGYREALEKTFAPEFLNRVDDIVVFNTLREDDVLRIVDLELSRIVARAEALGYRLRVTPRARKALAQKGYDSAYGVRSLKRVMRDSVEAPFAQMIVSDELSTGDTVRIDVRDKELAVVRHGSALATGS